MCSSDLELLDDLKANRAFAWLSIGATLLSGSKTTQKQMARIPRDLLDNPSEDGRGRSVTMPIVDARGDGWVLAWITQAPTKDVDEFAHEMSTYIQAKAHQWGMRRAAAFLYNETTRALERTIYESPLNDLTPEVEEALAKLRPADALSELLPPNAKGRAKNRSAAKRKRKGGRR